MGGGSTQQSSGQSGGNSSYNSNPMNMQYPGYQNLSGPVGSALSAAAFNPNPAASFETGTGGFLQPTQVWNQGMGQNVASNSAQNPLAAQMTGQQQQQLGYVNQLSPGYAMNFQGTPSNNAYSSAGQATNFAAQNPFSWANQNAGQASNLAGGTYQPAANMIGQAGQAAPGMFGAASGTANAAGQAAGSILPNASQPLAAGINSAMNGQFGGGLAGQAGQAASNGNFGIGQAGQAAQYAQNSGFGTGAAQNAGNYAQNSGFGTQAAGQANQFAQNSGFGAAPATQASQFAQAGQNLSPAQQAIINEMNPNFAANLATGGPTQQVIGAAINPLLQSFNAQTIPGLAGTFTAAGQRVNSAGTGVGGSSAYDMAGANALTGLGANIGATAAGIVNPTYQQGLGISAAAPGQYAALQQQQLSGLESAAATKASTQTAKEQALLGGQQALTQSQTAKAGALNQAAQTKLATQTGKEQALQGSAQTQMQTQAAQINALDAASQQKLQVATGKTAAQLSAAAAAGTLTAQESQALASVAGVQSGIASGLTGALTNAGAAMGNVGVGAANALTGASNASTAANQAQAGALNQAAQTNAGVSTSQLNDTINALSASALPQLTQQYGINQGLSLYNTQVQQVLQTLGLGGQISQPSIANQASGFGANFGTNQSSGKGITAPRLGS